MIYDDIINAIRMLPPNPVAPENRGLARLQPSCFVVRGSMFRLAPQPDITGHNRPLIVMNTEDVGALRAVLALAIPRSLEAVDQDIADSAEQLFALREAQERKS